MVQLNQIVNFAQLRTAQASGFRKSDRDEPELRVAPGLLDVDVVRLGTLATEEEKAVSMETKNLWHGRTLSNMSVHANCAGSLPWVGTLRWFDIPPRERRLQRM